MKEIYESYRKGLCSMVASGSQLLNHVDSVYNDIDSGVNQQGITTKIQLFQQELDEHVTVKSQEFNENKGVFLEDYLDRYAITDLEGFIPLRGPLERLPVTQKGLLALSVFDVDAASKDVWSRLASLDSIDAFEQYRQYVEREHSGGHVSTQEVVATLTEPDLEVNTWLYETFDDVSLDKIDRIGRSYEEFNNSVAYEYTQEYPEFIANNPDYRNDVDPYKSYLQSLSTPDYLKALETHIVNDTLDYEDAVKQNFTQSSIIKRKNYEQLLFGLYDNDSLAVASSGLKDEFERSMDTYFETSDKSISSLYIEDGSVDPDVSGVEFWDMLQHVSENMGFTKEEAHGFVDLLDHEERMYLEKGQMYAARGGTEYTEPGERDDRFKWLLDNYQDIYGHPVDYNVDHKRYHDSLGYDNDAPTDDMLDEMEQDFMSSRETQVNVTKQKKQDGLFNVSLNQSIETNHVATNTVDNLFDNVGAYIESTFKSDEELDVNSVTVPEDQQVFIQTFNKQLDGSIKRWNMSVEDMISDTDAFNDLLAVSTVQTVNTIKEPRSPEDAYTIGEAYGAINNVFKEGLNEHTIQAFADGYKEKMGVPLDASLKTINEVKREMGQPEDQTIDGELNYYDVSLAETPDDLERLRHDLKAVVQAEVEQEVDESMKGYTDYLTALEDDEDDWDLDF